MPEAISYEVFVAEPIPQNIPSLVPNGDRRMFSPLSITLISGPRDAVLVDPPLTRDQTAAVGDWVEASGKRLTHIFVTHGHGDHWFGANTLAERFGAQVVASAGTIDQMKINLAIRPAFWDTIFPGQIPDSPVTAVVPADNRFELEGNELRIVEVGHSDTDATSVLHVPAIDLVVAGDVFYNGVHQFLREAQGDGISEWLRAIDTVESLHPRSIVAGHKNKDLDDDARRTIEETRAYLRAATALLPENETALDFFNAMLERFPHRLNAGALWGGATALYPEHPTPTRYLADQAATEHVDGPLGETFAYRRLGTPGSAPPLVLVLRLRGTIDHWDPALLDALAAEREVIVFDNRGLNASTGEPASSVPELVDGALAFIHALGLEQIDLLGWSLGGIVAQGVALTEPGLVRRLIVAGSTPGGVPDVPRMGERVQAVVTKPVNDDEDFLYLFFPETEEGRAAGKASLERLRHRLDESGAAISPEAVRAQLTAIGTFPGYWDRLDELSVPVLLANGTNDVMIHADATYAAAKRLTTARTVLWSDAGHGFLFQHVDDFAREVSWFLGA